MSEPLDLDDIATNWLGICGYCDAMMAMDCNHPTTNEEARSVISALVNELREARKTLKAARDESDENLLIPVADLASHWYEVSKAEAVARSKYAAECDALGDRLQTARDELGKARARRDLYRTLGIKLFRDVQRYAPSYAWGKDGQPEPQDMPESMFLWSREFGWPQ